MLFVFILINLSYIYLFIFVYFTPVVPGIVHAMKHFAGEPQVQPCHLGVGLLLCFLCLRIL